MSCISSPSVARLPSLYDWMVVGDSLSHLHRLETRTLSQCANLLSSRGAQVERSIIDEARASAEWPACFWSKWIETVTQSPSGHPITSQHRVLSPGNAGPVAAYSHVSMGETRINTCTGTDKRVQTCRPITCGVLSDSLAFP
jgi:hypothetical protein